MIWSKSKQDLEIFAKNINKSRRFVSKPRLSFAKRMTSSRVIQVIFCKNSRTLSLKDKFEHYTAIPYRASTGPKQGFPCVAVLEYFHTGKNLFSLAGIPVMKTGFSLLEILHRENPVLITGMGLQCTNRSYKANSWQKLWPIWLGRKKNSRTVTKVFINKVWSETILCQYLEIVVCIVCTRPCC